MAGPGSTRERILDVALDLFTRRGYAETSLREIAGELGFSKAALYYHFESKQDILLALHMRMHSLSADVLPLLEADAGASDVWERVVERLLGIALRNRRLLELHIRNADAVGELHRNLEDGRHGPVRHDAEQHVAALLTDTSLPLAVRVRRTAALGAIASVLVASSMAFADVSDAELERELRAVVHDLAERPATKTP